MTALIEHYFEHFSAETMDRYACEYLAARSVDAKCVQSVADANLDLSSFSILISRGPLSDEMREKVACFGGRNLSRIESLEYTRRAGLRQMSWAAAETPGEVHALFDKWKTDRLLLKRSDTFKGQGLSMLSREDLTDLTWDPQRDVFCAEVNPGDGTVAKVECLGGCLIFQWMWKQPPIRELVTAGGLDTKAYLSGERIVDIRLPEDTVAKAVYCSELASRDGLGHTSLDLMRSPNGDWRVIELNTQEVAIWWTSKFESVRRNHAAAIHSLVRGNPALGG